MVTRGFTLLEMMLVIVLLGTVTSMIVPTLSSGTKPVAHGAAATFWSQWTRLRDEALVSGEMVGVRVEPDGYQLMVRRQGQWQPVSRARQSAQGTLPPQVRSQLELAALPSVRAGDLDLQQQRLSLHDIELEMQSHSAERPPQLVFAEHQLERPFSLRFVQSYPSACWQVSASAGQLPQLTECTVGG